MILEYKMVNQKTNREVFRNFTNFWKLCTTHKWSDWKSHGDLLEKYIEIFNKLQFVEFN